MQKLRQMKYIPQGLPARKQVGTRGHLAAQSLEQFPHLQSVNPNVRLSTKGGICTTIDITDSMDVSLSELRELVMDREAWRAVIHGFAKGRTRLTN